MFWGLQRKYGFSIGNVGVSNEHMGVWNENMGVPNKTPMEDSNERWWFLPRLEEDLIELVTLWCLQNLKLYLLMCQKYI